MDFREINEFFRDFGKYIIVVVAAILLFLYVISFMQVSGPSMEPTFKAGDLVFISKLHYRFGEPKRGDILVFENNGLKNLIKRVIGLPGDKIEFKDNTLYLNDQPYKEDYLGEDIVTYDFKSDVIPENCYLVLGDNRPNSQDSRELGCIEKDKIIGKVVFRFWPVNKMKMF